MATARFAQLKRPYTLVADLLAGKEHDRRSAAKRLGVELAAADRQLEALRTFVPQVVTTMRGKKTFYSIPVASPQASPSIQAAVAACFGASLAPLFAGTAYAKGLSDALEHVLSRSRSRGRFRHIDRKFGFLPKGGEAMLPTRAELLDEVVDALLGQNVLCIGYRHFDGAHERVRIWPLSVVVCDHQLYLVARRLDDGRTHPFRLARIDEAECDDQRFEYPPDYDLRGEFTGSFGVFLTDTAVEHVVVRLSPRWTTYVATHRWHPSQELRPHSVGTDIHMDVRVCPELEAWILSFGDDAEVLEPRSLRDRVAHRVARTSGLYATLPNDRGRARSKE